LKIQQHKRIIYAKDLIKELEKHPDAYICVGKLGDDYGRYDQRILNTYLRDGEVLVLNIENYKENNFIKFYE